MFSGSAMGEHILPGHELGQGHHDDREHPVVPRHTGIAVTEAALVPNIEPEPAESCHVPRAEDLKIGRCTRFDSKDLGGRGPKPRRSALGLRRVSHFQPAEASAPRGVLEKTLWARGNISE